jgi:hypothetical protein
MQSFAEAVGEMISDSMPDSSAIRQEFVTKRNAPNSVEPVWSGSDRAKDRMVIDDGRVFVRNDCPDSPRKKNN